jgi:elongation factor 3
MEEEKLAALFQTLSVGSAADLPAATVNHVKAEPRALSRLIPNLIELAGLSGKGSEVDAAVGALATVEALANECNLTAEAHLLSALPVILNGAGSKQARIRAAAESAAITITSKMSPNSVREVLPALFEASKSGVAFQTRILALKILASFSDHAPYQLGFSLPEIIPQVTLSMSEPKKEVSQAAFDAMTSACNVIGNRDIEHMTSKIVRSISHPDEVPELMHSLAGVTFVQSVESPALAMVVPLLIRGLRSKVTATRRQSAVIIDYRS